MEKPENEYRAVCREVSPSVVIVEQVGRVDYFCIGSVLLSEGENTFILTQSRITASSVNLSVRFFNGLKQSATLLARGDKLCVLVTKFYSKCKPLQFFEGDIDHTFATAIAPASKSSMYSLPAFIIQRSREAGQHNHQRVIEGSGDSFTFSCQYGDTSANRVSRLLSGPVFNLDAQVLGVVVKDMMYRDFARGAAGEIIHPQLYDEMAFYLKVGIQVSELQATLRSMAGDDNWQNGLKQLVLKATRDELQFQLYPARHESSCQVLTLWDQLETNDCSDLEGWCLISQKKTMVDCVVVPPLTDDGEFWMGHEAQDVSLSP